MNLAIASLVLFTVAVFFLRKMRMLAVCPICAAAVLTWVVGLSGLWLRASWADPLAVAILMGASLGALAERYGGKFGFIWKTGVVVFGFAAIYFAVSLHYWYTLGIGLILVLLTAYSAAPSSSPASAKSDLFKDCC